MLTAAVATFGQSTPQTPAFDVSSVRPNRSAVNGGSLNRLGGRFTASNFSLRDLIAFAFDIRTGRDYELSGPSWLDTERFDIAATFPAETPRDRVQEMLRTLLNERFHLRTHVETRKLESYALVVAKGGPKLPVRNTSSDGAFIFGDDHVTFRGFPSVD